MTASPASALRFQHNPEPILEESRERTIIMTSLRQREFVQVDVFTSVPYLGNALAVVKDATGLTPEQMQQFARWTNLSETTFLLPPTNPAADYLVKIYTPDCELPFAGHPTLGSAHAWLEAGGNPKDPEGKVIVQECGVGLVKIRREAGGKLALAAPKLMRTGPVDEERVQRACHVMGISREDVVDHEWLDNGPGWFGLLLKDAQKVLDVKLENLDQANGMDWGIVGLHAAADKQSGGSEDEPLVEIRAFAPSMNIPEDPVTGSFK